jgi:hypothetical protein
MALTRLGPNNSANISGINLTSQVTGTLPAANGGTGTTSYTSGITEADQWRVTTNFTPAGIVTANWERNDTNFDKIGTGMSESSGVFTFPSTGIWEVSWDVTLFYNGNSREIQTRIQMTTDNSSYSNVVENGSFVQQTDSNTTYAHGNANVIVDISDTANRKVKFYFNNTGSVGTADGSSTENKTWATFIRLGDT